MLVVGIIIGPVLDIFDPARDIGPLMGPIISIAVAIILFEGGLNAELSFAARCSEGRASVGVYWRRHWAG